MVVLRHRQIEQGLQQAVDMGGLEQVFAAGHQRDALERVVDGNRQMVAGRDVAAGQNHVAEDFRAGILPAFFLIVPGKRPGALQGARHAQSKRKRGSFLGPPLALCRGNQAVRIRRSALRRGVRGRECGIQLAPGEKAAIEQPHFLQPLEGRAVIFEMLRLPPDRLGPGQAEPAQIVEIAGLEFRLAARDVDILDPQQEAAAGTLRGLRREERGIGMAEMQISRRRGREARDGAGGGWQLCGQNGTPNLARRWRCYS